jgi:hypothetical protein
MMRSRTVHSLVVFALVLTTIAAVRAQSAAIGAWEFTTVSPEGTFVSQMEIREEGGKLVAVGKSSRGERPYDSIAVEGSRIVLVISISYNGMPLTITYRGEINGKEMSGDADYGGMATGSWSATRQ